MNKGMSAALIVMGLATHAQAQNAQRLTDLMAYCVQAVAMQSPTAVKAPDGVKVSRKGATWQQGNDAALLLGDSAGYWSCDLSGPNPKAMQSAAKAVFDGYGVEVNIRRKWTNAKAEQVVGNACINDTRVMLMVNGSLGETLGIGYFTVTDRFQVDNPC